MNDTRRKLERIRAFNAQIHAADSELREETVETTQPTLEVFEGRRDDDAAALDLESIILRKNRPVLAIKEGAVDLVFLDAEESSVWQTRLKMAGPGLEPSIPAVGRVDLTNHQMDWVGTAWLVAPTIAVTNRHVALEFASGDDLSFVAGAVGPVGAGVDFLHEAASAKTALFKVAKVLHIEPDPGPDLAFVEVERQSSAIGPLAEYVRLPSTIPRSIPNCAVIGYPASDSRVPEPDLMRKTFRDVYNSKRLAPGSVMRVGDDGTLLHDCSTLGGNSGSLVVNLDDGTPVGLHFSGRFLTSNIAVRADVVRQRLEALLNGTLRSRERASKSYASQPMTSSGAGGAYNVAPDGSVTVSIPLHVTVSLGAPPSAPAHAPPAPPPAPPLAAQPKPRRTGDPPPESPDDFDESAREDLSDRKGYVSSFLGEEVPLPEVRTGKKDVLTFGDEEEQVLKYTHFSVLMSAGRRMCRYSAVNIDGKRSLSSGRGTWRYDSRIPREAQIMKECYGNPPKFSRGHMTRREDPAWGDEQTADRGNQDSMHVTNTVPQMQAFNSPIWLGLENYALQNARKDRMKISVFTGPYFKEADPVFYDVKIPTAFWKIIAFLHDRTGKLTATGYEMSQTTTLPEEEYVFTNYDSPQLNMATQVSIASIAKKSGLNFGPLVSCDPLSTSEGPDGAFESVAAPLLWFSQIRFI